MTHEVTLVDNDVLAATLAEFHGQGTQAALQAFQAAEPTLASFLTENANRVAGKLALAGVSRALVRGVHADLLAAGLLAYLAARKGTYQVWQDTELGPRLRDLIPAPAEAPETPE